MTVKAHFHTIGGEMQEKEITIKLSYKYLIDKDYRSNIFEMQLEQRDESVFVRCTGCALGPQGLFKWRDHVDKFTEYDKPVYIYGRPAYAVGGYWSGCEMWILKNGDSTRNRFKNFTHLTPFRIEHWSHHDMDDIEKVWVSGTDNRHTVLFGRARICRRGSDSFKLYEVVADPKHTFLVT